MQGFFWKFRVVGRRERGREQLATLFLRGRCVFFFARRALEKSFFFARPAACRTKKNTPRVFFFAWPDAHGATKKNAPSVPTTHSRGRASE